MVQILLVDDDGTFLNGLKMFFDMKHISTITATTVSKAKELLCSEKISLICTDWDLPDGTGMDVLAYVRNTNIPVVFLTCHDEDSYQEQAITQGTACYYIKGQVVYHALIAKIITLTT